MICIAPLDSSKPQSALGDQTVFEKPFHDYCSQYCLSTCGPAFRKLWTKAVRLLFPDDRWTSKPALPSTAEVCRAAVLPGPAEALRAARLLHFIRLVGSCQETLLSLLLHRVAPQSWLKELEADVAWAIYLGGVPPSAMDSFPDGLIQLSLDAPGKLKRLIKRCMHPCLALPTTRQPLQAATTARIAVKHFPASSA